MPLIATLARVAAALARASRRRLAGLLVLVALGAASMPANALCVVACSCNATVTNVVFSPYQPFAGSNVDSTGTVRLTCGGALGLLIPATLSLSVGAGTGYTARALASGSNKLSYNLYSSSGYTTIVGDGTGGSSTLSGGVLIDALGVVTPQVWTLYGRIPGGQSTVIPGAYADTLLVTVTYQ